MPEGPLLSKERRIVRLTDEGIQSSPIVIKKEDSSAFFLNETSDSQVTLTIDVVTPSQDCASRNMKSDGSSVFQSSKAVVPSDFASVCFLNSGTYNYTVYGLRSSPSGLSGSIIVE